MCYFPAKKMFGKVFLASAVAAFVLQSITVQIVQGNQQNYYKPWFLLFIAHGSYIIFFPLLALYAILFSSARAVRESISVSFASLHISIKALVVRTFSLTCIFTSASLAWYISVSKIPLGDITAIYNTSSFFTYLLSVFLLGHRFIWFKFGAVILSVLGIMVISCDFNSHSQKQSNDVFLGYTSAVLSSLFAALYEIIYCKLIVPKTPSVFFSLFITGCMGLSTLALGVILFPLFHYTGLERIELPPQHSLVHISLVSILGITFNSLFLLAITFSGPILASTGILASIPLTYLADYFLFGSKIGANVWIGSFLIFLGYFLLQIQSKETEDQNRSQDDASRGRDDEDDESRNLLA